MVVFGLCILFGLIVLIWSADRFVDAASDLAAYYGMSPLLIGMVIVGFGTSAPEIVVSAFSSWQGNPGIALGNAFGSSITNIALILGLTSLFLPIYVDPKVLKKELPVLMGVTLFAIALLFDLFLSRGDALILSVVFFGIMAWNISSELKNRTQKVEKNNLETHLEEQSSIKASYAWLLGGMLLLVLSSRLLVHGAVGIALSLGVSDVIIGLTIVAIGTSLPELASTMAAAKKGESDMALGNIIGSNLFNTLAVVGISGAIHPTAIAQDIFYRDLLVLTALTLMLFFVGRFSTKKYKITRFEGLVLFTSYLAYISYLMASTFSA